MSRKSSVYIAVVVGCCLLLFHVAHPTANAQTSAPASKIVVQCDVACQLQIDGESMGSIAEGGVRNFSVLAGEHIVIAAFANGARWSRTLSVLPGRQVVAHASPGHLPGRNASTGYHTSTPTSHEMSSTEPHATSSSANSRVALEVGWLKDKSWSWENERFENAQFGRTSCQLSIKELLKFEGFQSAFSASDDKSLPNLNYNSDGLLEKPSDACLEYDDDPRANPHVYWYAPLHVVPEADSKKVSFSGTIQKCTGCSFSMVKGIAISTGSTLSITLESPITGTFELKQQ